MLNVAVPAEFEAETIPETPVLDSDREQDPIYALLSSPFKVAVIVNEKLTEGEVVEVAKVIE
jgi:hypothetical protein